MENKQYGTNSLFVSQGGTTCEQSLRRSKLDKTKYDLISLWHTNMNPSPPLGAFEVLKIFKNGYEMRKLWLPEVGGSK